MTIEEFAREAKAKQKEIAILMRDTMPVVVGRMAKDHYQDNFRKGGFVNNGLRKWTPAKRLSSGSQLAGANYGTLLSGRNHLMSSTNYQPGKSRVRLYNRAPHASVHQFGETVHPTITPKMRKFAWAMYYEAGGVPKRTPNDTQTKNKVKVKENEQTKFWKSLALTRKNKLSIKMPVRQFIGESAELNQKIAESQANEIRKILNT